MMKVTTTTALARDAIRCVRATASGCGIAGPAALRLADAADVLIAENERIAAINQIYNTTTKVEVIDLVDPNGKAIGTKVIVEIPL